MSGLEFVKPLLKVLKSDGLKYYLKSREISVEEIFSATGLMPAIAKRADNMCSLCLGYGLGVGFRDKEASMLGLEAEFDDAAPLALKVLFTYDVMEELRRNSASDKKIVLDELLYD